MPSPFKPDHRRIHPKQVRENGPSDREIETEKSTTLTTVWKSVAAVYPTFSPSTEGILLTESGQTAAAANSVGMRCQSATRTKQDGK